MKLRVNQIIKETRTEGIGTRYAIWVQGCSIRCKGCANRNMWSSSEGFLMETDRIISEIKSMNHIEGVTFLGGEPFDQPEPVARIAEEIHKAALSVIVFTGYRYETLRDRPGKCIKRILKYTDLLIDGPYEEKLQDFSRPWVGSSNQRYVFLSDCYSENDLKKQKTGQRFELRIQKDGKIVINGIGNLNVFEKFIDKNMEG